MIKKKVVGVVLTKDRWLAKWVAHPVLQVHDEDCDRPDCIGVIVSDLNDNIASGWTEKGTLAAAQRVREAKEQRERSEALGG